MAKKLAFDRVLFVTVMLLLGLGLVMVYSASALNVELEGGAVHPFLKQVLAAILGLVVMGVAMHMDLNQLAQRWVIYAIVIGTAVLLLATLQSGMRNDTHRWLYVGGLSIQTAELAKLALVGFLAYQIDRKRDRINGTSLLVPCGLLILLFAVLILLQPDFGTAGILVATAGLMLFLAGLAWRYIAAVALVSLPAVWILIMSVPYRRQRVLTFLTPEADPLGSGFQVMQSLIAVGSGGVVGRGLGQSVQKLHFLPYAESDFIFSILSEELGLIGALAVVCLFAVFLWRGVRAGLHAPDTFGRFLAWGLTGMIVIQAAMNIGVVLALIPATGAPLPLMSNGGSSLVTTLTACGLVLNVSQHG